MKTVSTKFESDVLSIASALKVGYVMPMTGDYLDGGDAHLRRHELLLGACKGLLGGHGWSTKKTRESIPKSGVRRGVKLIAGDMLVLMVESEKETRMFSCSISERHPQVSPVPKWLRMVAFMDDNGLSRAEFRTDDWQALFRLSE